jgi:5-methylcytosine-specific restriction endonuclease McrA
MESQYLETFLEESNELAGITINGHFDIDITVFAAIYEHYRETEENLLDSYALVYKEDWMPEEMISREEFNKRMRAISKIKSLGVMNESYLRHAHRLVREKRQSYLKWLNRLKDKPRKEACSFTNKPEVKEEIFSFYGEKCLACGSIENIALDHIKPVSKGGVNKIENLQPLCKSCNSKKGSKTIDYRK